MKKGTQVTWNFLDGSTMTGEVVGPLLPVGNVDQMMVKRIDGTTCNVARANLRKSVLGDMEKALRFYANIGK